MTTTTTMIDRRFQPFQPFQRWILSALVGLSACKSKEPDPEHCWNAKGDATCMELFGFERIYCTTDAAPCSVEADHGCVAQRPTLDECHSPCGGGRSSVEASHCRQVAGAEEWGGDASDDQPPGCGNGRRDPGEECDDGNNLAGDGCTVECRRPGSMIAERLYDEFIYASAVVIDSNSDITVLARLADSTKKMLVKFDADLSPQWTKALLDGSSYISLKPDDDILVCATWGAATKVQMVSPAGAVIWRRAYGEVSSICNGIAGAGEYTVSAGAHLSDRWRGMLIQHDGRTGAMLKKHDWDPGWLGPVAVDDLGRVWTVGQHKEEPELRAHAANVSIALDYRTVLEPGAYGDMIVDHDRNVYLLGRRLNDRSNPTFWMTKIRDGGEVVWSTPPYENADAASMALVPGGAVLVAGYEESGALLIWYSQADGDLVHTATIDNDGVLRNKFYGVAVAPTGRFGVAVGEKGKEPNSGMIWVYQFEN